MGITGTEVSKEAAKMVLADDNFATIVIAVREGRRVWDNLRKLLIFNLPVNFAQGFSIWWGYVVGFEQAPLTAIQVLYVNMVTACTMGMSLAVEPAEPGVMNKPPRRIGKRLLGKLVLWRCVFVCVILVILVLGMYEWALSTVPEEYSADKKVNLARAEAFNVLVFCEIGYCLTTRFIKMSTFHPRVFKGNYVIFLTMALTAGMQVFITYVPGFQWFFNMPDGIAPISWARVFVCMVVVYIVVEIEKRLVDPVMMPIIRPCFGFIYRHSPKFFKMDADEDEHDQKSRVRRQSLTGSQTMDSNCGTPTAGGGGAPALQRTSATYGVAVHTAAGGPTAVRTASGRLTELTTTGAAPAPGEGKVVNTPDVKLTLEDAAKLQRSGSAKKVALADQ
uniref:Cation-transporting P-type ATPase C-terminal domain-containing protein n=1 Tax=Chlamydomonas euryale TaxID=1486919 RepID=A0A7R9Z7E3_9CHLO